MSGRSRWIRTASPTPLATEIVFELPRFASSLVVGRSSSSTQGEWNASWYVC